MGRVKEWFKSLFGIKKRKEKNESVPVLCQNPVTIPPNITEAEAAWLMSAEAAVAASVAMKLTNNVRVEQLAAVKIQSTFRGYLGRKALKGLRAVVKLQALVRGILVRNQAKATLHGMEALIRAQKIVRDKKIQSRYQKFDHNRLSYNVKERVDDTKSEYITTPHSKRVSYYFDTKKNPVVVEVGRGWPKSRFRRSNNSVSDPSHDLFCPIRYNNLSRLSVQESQNSQDPGWAQFGDECHSSTAHSTPRFLNGSNRFANGPYGPATPANSVCGTDDVFRSYMSDTQSYRAKLRCQSAPRMRPDIRPKKRQSLIDFMESRNSHSGVRMQRSCSQAQDVITFNNAVMCNLERCGDSGRAVERASISGRKL